MESLTKAMTLMLEPAFSDLLVVGLPVVAPLNVMMLSFLYLQPREKQFELTPLKLFGGLASGEPKSRYIKLRSLCSLSRTNPSFVSHMYTFWSTLSNLGSIIQRAGALIQ